MSRQRGSPNDPTSRRGLLSLAIERKSVLPDDPEDAGKPY